MDCSIHKSATALALSLMLLCSFPLRAQKTVTVSIEKHPYEIDKNVSLREAEMRAIQSARMKAIQNEFGTEMTQSETMLNTNRELAGDKAVSRSEYVKWAASNIAAVWVGDIEAPKCERKYDADRGDYFEVSLRGKVMKKEQASINFCSRVLRNGTKACHYDTKYQSHDDLFLSFNSPEAGYLTVYITDGDTVYCLLPYMNSANTAMPVQRDSTYVFFSTDKKHVQPEKAHLVDELTLYCEGDEVAIHELYVVFSPNKYSRPSLQKAQELEGGMMRPRNLTKKEFRKWLERSLSEDKEMSFKTELLIVSPSRNEP